MYKELIECAKDHAKTGEALWQTNLGYMYRRALGVKVNHEEGYKWYRVAAEQGLGIAQKLLGDLYANDFVGRVFNNLVISREYKKSGYKDSLEYNERKAVELYSQSAAQGYVPALTRACQQIAHKEEAAK
ncbi:MAG: tetratricopeptide repeat protein [Candidatus Amoebophilus sp.]